MQNDIEIVRLLNALRGGTASAQEILDRLGEFLDLARSPQSGTTVMTGAELTLYEQYDTKPFKYSGGWIDWTGLNAGAGENTTVRLYLRQVSGGAYRQVWSAVYLAAAVPTPALRHVPNETDAVNPMDIPQNFYNVYGVKVTAIQAAIGGGWNTLTHSWYDQKR